MSCTELCLPCIHVPRLCTGPDESCIAIHKRCTELRTCCIDSPACHTDSQGCCTGLAACHIDSVDRYIDSRGCCIDISRHPELDSGSPSNKENATRSRFRIKFGMTFTFLCIFIIQNHPNHEKRLRLYSI